MCQRQREGTEGNGGVEEGKDAQSNKFAGKVKESAGDLTGDKDLKAEGEKQQVAGDVKNVGENVKDKADELGEKIKD